MFVIRVSVNGDNSQQSLVSDNCNIMANGVDGSHHSMNGPRSEVHCGLEVNGLVDGLAMTSQTANGFVNSSESPKADAELDFVNNVKFVNNNLDGTEMENHLEDEVDGVD